MVSDGGQIASIPEFQDEQGINMDDEEAIDVEQGEFGKPQLTARKPPMTKKAVTAVVTKRSISVASSQSVEEVIKKKKAKKA